MAVARSESVDSWVEGGGTLPRRPLPAEPLAWTATAVAEAEEAGAACRLALWPGLLCACFRFRARLNGCLSPAVVASFPTTSGN